MSRILRKIAVAVLRKASARTEKNEYDRICRIFRRRMGGETFAMLEVGSGLCGFPLYLRERMPGVRVTCLDINPELVKHAKSNGFKAVRSSLVRMSCFPDNSFDVVHCSHVVEHLKYPDITLALDELVRIVRPSGLIVIRTPLWANHRFYNDIDHVRPYPPTAILNYFSSYAQQQKRSRNMVERVDGYVTRIYLEIDQNKYPSSLVKAVNFMLKLCWLVFGLPFDQPNNYGIFLRKKKADLS